MIDGISYPSDPGIEFNVPINDYLSGYKFFLDNVGICGSDTEISINPNQYLNGKFILAFDLSPRGNNGLRPHKTLDGVMSFHATFTTALANMLSVLVYGIYESNIIITKGLVEMDYQV